MKPRLKKLNRCQIPSLERTMGTYSKPCQSSWRAMRMSTTQFNYQTQSRPFNITLKAGGLSRRDLEPYIGSRGRVSGILNRKRPLSLNMIRKLEKGLGIPADILIQPYRLVEGEISAKDHQWGMAGKAVVHTIG